MTSSPLRILIIGGGASGVLLACHLLRDHTADLRVTLIEKRLEVGHGIAFGTGNADHILNVRAANMSAFADEPDHFWCWLVSSGEVEHPNCSDPFCFVPRRTYGRYLEQLLRTHAEAGERPARLNIVRGECVSLREAGAGVAVTLADGSIHVGHCAVLATGHDAVSVLPATCSADPWDEASLRSLNPDEAVVIVGTGLTMVDYALSLIGAGYRGPIHAISRHGLLPQVHRRIEPFKLDIADVPLGTDFGHLWRWFRQVVRWHVERGGDWRGAFDGLRPFVQEIWRNLPAAGKRRFLRHARTVWDIHRHRMAPEVATKLRAAIAGGQLRIVAGKVLQVEPNVRGATVRFRRRGKPVAETLRVGRVVECKGVVTDPTASRNPILRDLFRQELARPDPVGIGIEVGDDCSLAGTDATRSSRLFAVGPLTRAAFWEVIAVPDIRAQAAMLARRLTAPDVRVQGSPPVSQPTRSAGSNHSSPRRRSREGVRRLTSQRSKAALRVALV